MDDVVYKVITSDDEVYWVSDASEILNSFGTVAEVTRYELRDPVDVTDEINGRYYLD